MTEEGDNREFRGKTISKLEALEKQLAGLERKHTTFENRILAIISAGIFLAVTNLLELLKGLIK